jgi:hypothetical protein
MGSSTAWAGSILVGSAILVGVTPAQTVHHWGVQVRVDDFVSTSVPARPVVEPHLALNPTNPRQSPGATIMSVQSSRSGAFVARTVKLTGSIILDAPIAQVFPLFSPMGEKHWVEGWNPEILFPLNADWVEGMVFRTFSDRQDEIWTISELDLASHRVVYYRVEPGRLVARVEVVCRALNDDHTEVTTLYSYVGLSEAGNAHVADWTDAAYRAKMNRWKESIAAYLRSLRK